MTTPTETTFQAETTFHPSPAQLERRQRLRRFNQTAVYLPIGVFTVVILALIVLLLWRNLALNDETMQSLTSALADLIIVIMLLPLMLVCATLPLGAVAFTLYRRQNKSDQPPQSGDAGSFHRFLWRVESMVNKIRLRTDRLADRVAQPVINFNARLAYLRAFLKNLFNRS